MKLKLKNLSMAIMMSTIVMGSSAMAADSNEKIVIAHRGASGYLPEHTLPAKAMAYAQGADYLEQDLVMTKDDHLVVLHDHYLDRVTDVADRFPDRARKDGRYYAIDFTLDEIKSLKFTEGFDIENGKKVQTYPGRFPMGKSDFRVHTFEEEIEFVQGLNHSTGKNIGVYLQCFDADELKRIKNELEPKMGMDLNLVQLIAYTDWNETQQKQPDGSWVNYNYDWMFKPGAMKQVAEYADGIGPDYHMLIEETSQPGNIKLTGMVQDAQQNKLVVHPYTVRSDKLPEYTTDVNQLYDALYNKAGVNGLFTDFPDKAVKFLNKE